MAKIMRQGAIGALLDEYERAIADLRKVIEKIPDEELTIILDAQTKDENCRSFQSILSHVVNAAYGYATSIYNLKEHRSTRPSKTFHPTIRQYQEDLTEVFSFTEKVFSELTDGDLEQSDNSLKIKSGWGQVYDIEQMTEHAIVHILRHRRQIEKFKLIL